MDIETQHDTNFKLKLDEHNLIVECKQRKPDNFVTLEDERVMLFTGVQCVAFKDTVLGAI